MLTKMYLTNFLSFSERTEFDFSASKYSILGETNVSNSNTLKGALFIGPNASGKSNALKGIVFIIDLIKGEGASFAQHRYVFCAYIILNLIVNFFLAKAKLIFYDCEGSLCKNTSMLGKRSSFTFDQIDNKNNSF